MKTATLLIALLTILPTAELFAAEPSPQGSSLQAYKLVKEKKWKEANAEAKRATELQPHDAEAWFLLGLTEERLEHLDNAVSAYEKYLQMGPEDGAARAVNDKLPGLRARARSQSEDTYGRTSNGFFVEKTLSYSPSFPKEVNGSLDAPFGVGFHFGKVFLGYRRASGKFTEAIKVPNETTKPVSYNTVSGGGSITHQELFANIHFSLVDPYTTWGNLSLTLPFYMAGFQNTFSTTSNGKKYGNIGYDLGLGLGLRGYTRAPFSWFVQGIYHVGIPFWGIREGGSDNGIRNARNDDVKGNITGFEATAGITILFGDEKNKHY